MPQVSIIIPAFNEEEAIIATVERVRAVAAQANWELEVIVVDDGSTDQTASRAQGAGATVIRNPVNGGYGLSLQRGIRAARFPYVAITDADGTYPVESLPMLYQIVEKGADMAVGARQGDAYRQSWWKHPARILFRLIAEFVAGRRIPDINSGLRVMRRATLLPYLSRTCMGFSFTTSITLILMLNGHFVDYRPISYATRVGESKIRHFRDTLRTAQIMTSIIAAHNPIKLAIMVGIVATLLAVLLVLLAWMLPFPWGTPLAGFGYALVTGLPIVFMLGCLGEILRVHLAKSHDA